MIGLPDKKYGEQVCTRIKLREGVSATADETPACYKGKIAHFRVPHSIRFVDEFTITVMGKVQKDVMREQMAGQLEANKRQSDD